MGTTPQQTRTLGPASPAPVSCGPSASSTTGGVGNVSRIQAPVRTRLRPPNNAVIEDQSVYAGRRAAAAAALATQRQRVAPGGPLLDREGNVTDFRYWFAKVYPFVTDNELRFTDRRAYYYPSYVMASVAYFEQIYADNYAALDAQGPVEEQ